MNGVTYTLGNLFDGRLVGHNISGTNIVVNDIILGDSRNGSEYRCFVVQSPPAPDITSDPAFLYVAGELLNDEVMYIYVNCTYALHYTLLLHVCSVLNIYIYIYIIASFGYSAIMYSETVNMLLNYSNLQLQLMFRKDLALGIVLNQNYNRAIALKCFLSIHLKISKMKHKTQFTACISLILASA